MKREWRWWRENRRLLRVYDGMCAIAEEHRAKGHIVKFVAVDEWRLELICWTCRDERT